MIVVTLLAGGCALALLVVIYWRAARRTEALQGDLKRLQVLQRDMSSDVRSRLEEGARSWNAVERDLLPRLDAIEPSLADLSAALEENLPTLAKSGARLERLEGKLAQMEADLGSARQESGEAAGQAECLEAALRSLRNGVEERLADLSARLQALEAPIFEAAPDGPDPAMAPAAEIPVSAAPLGGRGTPAPQRGTPRAHGGRWIALILALLTGLVLVFAALA